jgi:hypothetical protein
MNGTHDDDKNINTDDDNYNCYPHAYCCYHFSSPVGSSFLAGQSLNLFNNISFQVQLTAKFGTNINLE